MSVNLEFATSLGAEFAAQLNDSQDAPNWSQLGRDDDVPDGDYMELKSHYGDDFEDSNAEIEKAYKAGFNSVLVPFNKSYDDR